MSFSASSSDSVPNNNGCRVVTGCRPTSCHNEDNDSVIRINGNLVATHVPALVIVRKTVILMMAEVFVIVTPVMTHPLMLIVRPIMVQFPLLIRNF